MREVAACGDGQVTAILQNEVLLVERIDPRGELRAVERPDLLGGVVTVAAAGARVLPPDPEWLYGTFAPTSRPEALEAIPYAWWGNRGEPGMRVWIPTTP